MDPFKGAGFNPTPLVADAADVPASNGGEREVAVRFPALWGYLKGRGLSKLVISIGL